LPEARFREVPLEIYGEWLLEKAHEAADDHARDAYMEAARADYIPEHDED
jgi:hypothetical protein